MREDRLHPSRERNGHRPKDQTVSEPAANSLSHQRPTSPKPIREDRRGMAGGTGEATTEKQEQATRRPASERRADPSEERSLNRARRDVPRHLSDRNTGWNGVAWIACGEDQAGQDGECPRCENARPSRRAGCLSGFDDAPHSTPIRPANAK